MVYRRLLAAAALFSALLNTAAAAGAGAGLVGQPAPAFALPDLAGREQGPRHWRGQVVILNFWASWCAPCRQEIPLLNRIQARHGGEGLRVIGLAVDNRQAVDRFSASLPIRYPVLVGGKEALAIVQRYGNGNGALPYTVIIDRRGRIAARAAGLLDEAYLRRTLAPLL